MRVLGEACLLVCLITTGYAAFLSVVPGSRGHVRRQRTAALVGFGGFAALTVAIALLIWALASRDYRFEYVARYASRLLPWHYSVSALWVGQAGSLLLWAWMTAALAMALRILPTADAELRSTAFGLMMGNVWFLAGVMAFAADPMAASSTIGAEGEGLSPLLQHPSMLVHPPVVFLAYAAWGAPCALAVAALVRGRLDATWTRMARPWALFAWALLSAGLLLGAHWAYQELGWGGYWGWDPVENGSLLPWLTGTALLHSLMAWRLRQRMKAAAVSLAMLTFALCNFATFLTRSGIFSSVHAFSESPIGWMFLGLMGALLVGGGTLVARRRRMLAASGPLVGGLTREALVVVSVFLLLLLTAVVLVGTLVAPVSTLAFGRTIEVGAEFYNNVLPPIGLALLGMTALVPLLSWGAPPTRSARRLLAVCAAAGLAAVAAGAVVGMRHPVALAVTGLSALAATVAAAALLHDVARRRRLPRWRRLTVALSSGRQKYAAYTLHIGFACLAIGVTGSSLGNRQRDVTLDEGDVIQWEGRQLRYVRLEQQELADKLTATAVLEAARSGEAPTELRPARQLHLLQNQWTTEVAVQSTWAGDLYVVLNAGLGDGRVALTLVSNPLIWSIWAGGLIAVASAVVAIWPPRRRRRAMGGGAVAGAATRSGHGIDLRRASAA